ncbi:hypothetical protein Emed_004656 [Eimeria media]
MLMLERSSSSFLNSFMLFVRMEPTSWTPTAGCLVRGEKAQFTNVDLAEDWADFDEAANKSVGIYGLEFDFVVHKK